MNISVLRKLPFWRNYTTKQWANYWRKRKIDWKTAYFDTWNHPHRTLIAAVLKTFDWYSLMEIGCGAGANLVNIIKNLPGRQVGGTDISKDAIDTAEQYFKNGVFKVCPADDVMMSDKSTDVALTDMTLIYVGCFKIKKHLRELKRITRKNIILCEFHSESLWQRVKAKLTTGYSVYNYRKLLAKEGFNDIELYKIPVEWWPGTDNNQQFRYIIKAKVPIRG